MKHLIQILFIGLVIMIFSSCTTTKDYERAIQTNSVTAYENYLNKYPNNKYKAYIEKRLETLYEDQAWNKAVSINSKNEYENYLRTYQTGKHVEIARNRLEKIEKQIELDNAWNKTKYEDTINGYNLFLKSYPNSKYTFDAESQLRLLKETNDWKTAYDKNTISSYSYYLKNNPNGKFSETALIKLEELKEEENILPFWNEIKKMDTYEGYSNFLRKYPNSSYSDLATAQMDRIENTDWNTALRLNTIKSFRDYIKKYPSGEYIDISEKKIIDLEVDKIFSGNYGRLPPTSKNSYEKTTSLTNSIELYNDTPYDLTIRYSGIQSEKVILSSQQRKTVIIKNGNYRVTASVNSARVQNYGGTENLTGGSYTSKYFIRTERR